MLQRVIVDFGADLACGRVPDKRQEHYGISMPISTIRKLTEPHAKPMLTPKRPAQVMPNKPGCHQQIGELDGSMIPIMEADEDAEDKRKNKTLSWKETRLSIVPEKGSVSPKFDVVFPGTVDEAGQGLLKAAIQAGCGQHTQLHAVGDGATWIAQQVEDKFGTQGHYWLDFYPVCEYLAAASPHCVPEETPKPSRQAENRTEKP